MWARRYIKRLLAIFVFFVFSTALAVTVIDPYDVFAFVKNERLNQKKFKYEAFERLSKIYQVRRFQPKAIILGSSVSDVGLRPKTLEHFAGKAFNLAFAGGGIQEANLAFQFALDNTPVKVVVIGLEMFGFGQINPIQIAELKERTHGGFWSTAKELIRHTLSADAVYDSLLTAYGNMRGKQGTHTVDGQYIGFVPAELPTAPSAPVAIKFAEPAFTAFRKMCLAAKSRNIDFRIFVTPFHRNYVVDETQRLAWLRRVDAIAGDCGFRVQRFTESELGAPNIEVFLDTTHFHPDAGDRILRALFQNDRAASESHLEFQKNQTRFQHFNDPQFSKEINSVRPANDD